MVCRNGAPHGDRNVTHPQLDMCQNFLSEDVPWATKYKCFLYVYLLRWTFLCSASSRSCALVLNTFKLKVDFVQSPVTRSITFASSIAIDPSATDQPFEQDKPQAHGLAGRAHKWCLEARARTLPTTQGRAGFCSTRHRVPTTICGIMTKHIRTPSAHHSTT